MRAKALPFNYLRLMGRIAGERRARRAVSDEEFSSLVRASFGAEALTFFANLPLRARLANQFVDAMLAIEEALSMCEIERGESRDASWIEPQIQTTYDQVNALMKAVSN
jgi:Leu/Phe-tRNA-protein transferase